MEENFYKEDCMWQGMDFNDYLFEEALRKLEEKNESENMFN